MPRTLNQNPALRPELQIDVAHDCTIGELLQFMETYDACMIDYVVVGPAGGNPLITFSFPDSASLHLFKSTYQIGLCNPVSMVMSVRSQDDQPE